MKFFILALFITGLTDFLTTILCLNAGYSEHNFYVPFLMPLILTGLLLINKKLNNNIIIIGCIVVLISLLPTINNSYLYITGNNLIVGII